MISAFWGAGGRQARGHLGPEPAGEEREKEAAAGERRQGRPGSAFRFFPGDEKTGASTTALADGRIGEWKTSEE